MPSAVSSTSDSNARQREYFAQHNAGIEELLQHALNEIYVTLPEDPRAELARIIDGPLIASRRATAETPTAWTLSHWLESLSLAEPVERALASSLGDSIEHFRTGSREALEAALDSARLGGLTEIIWSASQHLRTKQATVAEMQAKFVQDDMGCLEYTDLSTFFGGLEAYAGWSRSTNLWVPTRAHCPCRLCLPAHPKVGGSKLAAGKSALPTPPSTSRWKASTRTARTRTASS